MNIPKSAIEKAIEGGWKERGYIRHRAAFEVIALDPTFWQALGKVLGLEGSHMDALGREQWSIAAHRFYDLILTGGDTAAFWAELGL